MRMGLEPTRVDWAVVGRGALWHAFPRVRVTGAPPEAGLNANGETQLLRSVCGLGPGRTPYSGMRLSPTCSRCRERTAPAADGSPHDIVA